MASHNSRFKVPSYIPVNGQIINNESLKSEQYLDNISEWTIKQRMVLNEKKTKAMIVNFTDKYQFSTRLRLNNANVDLVESMKILRTIFNSRLDWDQYCKEIVKKVNKRMVFLRKVHSFGANQDKMADIWVTYCPGTECCPLAGRTHFKKQEKFGEDPKVLCQADIEKKIYNL